MSQQQIIKLLTLLLVTITTKVNAQLNINASGVTLKQIIDTVEGTSPELNDTSEGGSLRRFNAAKTFWSARVSHNDSSGDNMFKQYRSALSSAVHAKYAGPCSGSGQFQGAWQCTGPDELDMQAMGYVECIPIAAVLFHHFLFEVAIMTSFKLSLVLHLQGFAK